MLNKENLGEACAEMPFQHEQSLELDRLLTLASFG